MYNWKSLVTIDITEYQSNELLPLLVLRYNVLASGVPKITRIGLRLGSFFKSELQVLPQDLRLSYFLLYSVFRGIASRPLTLVKSAVSQSYWETSITGPAVFDFCYLISERLEDYISFEKTNFFYSRSKLIVKDFYFFSKEYPKTYQDFLYFNTKNGFVFFFDTSCPVVTTKDLALQLQLKLFGVL